MHRSILIVLLLMSLLPMSTVLAGGGISVGVQFTHAIEEGIVLYTSYWSDYGAEKWWITDNKILNMKLEVGSQPDGSVILIEHMHVDCLIHSYRQDLDGLTQDMMDDKIHAGDQAGFLVTRVYPYEEIFSIEGYSEYLINGWMWIVGDFGSGRITQKRLTEGNVRDAGALGSEFVIIYDVLIKRSGDAYWHKQVIKDNFYVFLDGSFEPPEGEELKHYKAIFPFRDYVNLMIIVTALLSVASIIVTFYRSTKDWRWRNEHANVSLLLWILFILAICAAAASGLFYVYHYEVLLSGK